MSMSKLIITLSIAFGFLLLALVAEVWYLLCWRKRRTHAATEIDHKEIVNTESDLERGINNHNEDGDVVLKTFVEESVEEELKRLHNLAGPPRFLFTIKEETKEDLESEDGKSKCDIESRKGSRTRSLSDLMVAIDTPFLNSVASSTLKSSLDSYMEQGFNPLFESSSLELEINKFRSSPPPKFKFLRDAEEKLFRRMVEEAQRKAQMNIVSVTESEVQIQLQFPSSSSQILPLESSPSTFRPT